jgi:hypothetical protein
MIDSSAARNANVAAAQPRFQRYFNVFSAPRLHADIHSANRFPPALGRGKHAHRDGRFVKIGNFLAGQV